MSYSTHSVHRSEPANFLVRCVEQIGRSVPFDGIDGVFFDRTPVISYLRELMDFCEEGEHNNEIHDVSHDASNAVGSGLVHI